MSRTIYNKVADLYVKVIPSVLNGYAHVQLEFWFNAEPFEGQEGPRYERATRLGYGHDTLNGFYFKDLLVRSQYDKGNDHFYGFEAEYYGLSFCDPEEGQLAVNTLKKIQKGLQRISDDLGTTRSFIEYAIRLCKVLGVKGVLCETYDGRQYIEPKKELQGVLWNACYQVCQEVGANAAHIII